MAKARRMSSSDDDDDSYDEYEDEYGYNGTNGSNDLDDGGINVKSEHPDLDYWEKTLRESVDEDFFEEPRNFHTLDRVIEVLGTQAAHHPNQPLQPLNTTNDAYRALKNQRTIVEDIIKKLADRHCAELNSGVVQVGKVARQFSEAVNMVRVLRRQVREIKETLGTTSHLSDAEAGAHGGATTAAQATAMSLRELWLKKLECEAVLSLLEKMEIVRAAPSEFDQLISPPGPCRIGAAVVTVSSALDIAFHSNVSHVHALQNVSAQLTDRKQMADQIIWDTLMDVIFLRTGNGVDKEQMGKKPDSISIPNSQSLSDNLRGANSMKNPFITQHRLLLASTDVDDDDDDDSMASWFSIEAEVLDEDLKQSKMMIPQQLLEAELDLISDEQRCLEESMLAGGAREMSMWEEENANRNLPRYADHVLALRILVECLAKLKKLDDVQSRVADGLAQEIRKLAQKEQAKTFGRLEKMNQPRRRNKDLKDFRRHMTGLLSSFGCVQIRLCHLAQILRHKITSDDNLVLFSYEDKASAMHSVIVEAYNLMQAEIRGFLQSCLKEEEDEDHHRRGHHNNRREQQNGGDDSRGLFSLGITESPYKKDPLALQPESRANQMQQSASKFVANVLMPKTNSTPEVRHALEFRRSIATWTTESETLHAELAEVSGQDTTTPSYRAQSTETALHFLDTIIKKNLIPVLQHDAINGTTKALEREDAFDPVIDRTLYGRPNSNEPQDVDMCIACQALYYSTGPLFMALHRLPKDEKMYLHVVGVLEHAILTFISRVKPRVGELCNDKMALRLLLDTGKDGKDKAFGVTIEKRKAFQQLLNAYANGDLLESANVGDGDFKDPSLLVSGPSGDTKKNGDKTNSDLDLVGGVEKEEQILAQELTHLQPILQFTKSRETNSIVVCTDEELMKASCLAHSLLKLASLLEARLKVRAHSSGTFEKTLTSTRALREAIKTIKAHGLKVAKFCRIDMLMQNLIRLQKICKSSTIVAKDAVRIPSCVNDLGEYLTGASDNLREAGGNAVTSYTFSSLEQYIPFFLMQTVRIIARGEGIVAKSPLTLNGVEALDRSGSVLYRDLKGATSFDNSYWDDELAAISFERSASFMAMMEVEMAELETYFRGNHQEFSDSDFELMFAMNGPRRRGDPGRYVLLKKKMQLK